MIYYVVGGLDKGSNKKYLAYDIDSDQYYWTDTSMEDAVVRFESTANALSVVNARDEFNLVINTGMSISLPELLFNMEIPSITIEQVVYFEPVQVIDFTTVLTDYHTRKDLFDTKLKELESI